jgi:hypothetical protein
VIKVEAGAEKTITFPVWLTTGVNQLGLRSLDPTTRVEPADPRVQVLKAAGMSIASETNQEYPPTFLSSN